MIIIIIIITIVIIIIIIATTTTTTAACPHHQNITRARAHASHLSLRKERRQWTNPNHIIPSMAETRAKSRAISDLLGIGDAKE